MPGYKTWATNDVPTASDFNELFADPLSNDVSTQQTTTSTSYTDLATSGPAVTKTLVNGQKCLVYVGASIGTIANGNGFISFAVSGATTLAASDANAAEMDPGSGVNIGGIRVGAWSIFTATAGGSHTFTAKYKTDGNSCTFQTRRIIVKPF